MQLSIRWAATTCHGSLRLLFDFTLQSIAMASSFHASAPCLLLVAALLAASLPGLAHAKEWKSGEIVSRDFFTYGAFETRFKPAKGSGGISGFILIAKESEPWQELAYEFFGKGTPDYQTQIIVPGPPEPDPTARQPRSQHSRRSSTAGCSCCCCGCCRCGCCCWP